jgi:ABC-type Zn uptake system ZnuABC Zn-binding protein ZnuA
MPNGGPHPPCELPHTLLEIAKNMTDELASLRKENARQFAVIKQLEEENAALKTALKALRS